MRSISLCLLLSALGLTSARALVDTNSNGVSDIWEKTYNNEQLFTTFDPDADPDGDGWTNAREAIAGTDPFNPTPAIGFPLPDLTHIAAVYGTDENNAPVLQTPEGFIVHWGTEIGKQYTLFGSPDLSPGSWFPIDDPIVAMNREIQIGMSPAYTDGSLPPALFWRAAVNDVDSDGDGFTDYEEFLLGTDANIADSDADGLPDLWEIYYGLDPHDNGSTNPDNGPNGDPDNDGFTTAAEFAGASSPQNGASQPAGAGTGGPSSQAIGDPPLLVTETIDASGIKYGFEGFDDFNGVPNAHRRYLKEVYVNSRTGTSAGGAGTTTSTYEVDPVTGNHTHPPDVTTGNGAPASVGGGAWVSTSDTVQHRGYTNPYNGETFATTHTLSTEYTTDQFKANIEAKLPAYTGTFSEYNPNFAFLNLGPQTPPTAYVYHIWKLRYKWDLSKKLVSDGETVNWLEVFTPFDGGTPVFEVKNWTNISHANTSPPFDIDPKLKNSGQNGIYTVVPAEFELRYDQDVIQGWDSTKRDDWMAVGVGKTSGIARLWLKGISEEAAKKLELVVDKGSEGYIRLQNNVINNDFTEFEVTGLKATSPLGCKILLKPKDRNETITTLHVNVFNKVEVKVAIYNVIDGRSQHANTEFARVISDPDIEKKLNEIYGPQANLNFKVILSKNLKMGVNPADPLFFDPDGKFDYDTFRQEVITKANTPAHVLPIFFVKELVDSSKIGVTNTAQTDCFINNIAGCDITAAHEIGHYYNLSTMKQGQANLHDMGPWPQELINAFGTAKTGLLHETGGITQANWLRQNDWIEANAKAQLKSK